jgi:hypothetical protein
MAVYLQHEGLFALDATSTDPQRDGSCLRPGAQVYYQRPGEDRRPITITSDNGRCYDWVEGHQPVAFSNDRSTLYLTEHVLDQKDRDTVRMIRTLCAAELDAEYDYPFFWGSYDNAPGNEAQALRLSREVADREILRIFRSERTAPNIDSDFETVLVMCHG